jgi:hypothetical protein
VTDKNMLFLQICTDAPRVEHGLCSDTSVRSSGDGNGVISVKIEEEEMCVKEEDEPIAGSFSSINDESEVSPQTFHRYLRLPTVIMLFCLCDFPHKTAPCGEWTWSVYIYRVC